MATVLTVTYSSNTAITFDVSSVAQSPSFIAGRQSAEVDNTTNQYVDALVNCDGITWSSTSNTVGQEARLYVLGQDTSFASQNLSVFNGADGAVSSTTATFLQTFRLAAAVSAVVTTGSLVYGFQPFSVASLFGGIMPKYWQLYLTHSMTGSIHTGQSGLFSYNGIKYTMT